MCGIGGVFGQAVQKLDPQQTSSAIAAQIRHRGPDGAAYFADQQAILVHTRLSIIDITGGTQPIHNEDKSIWVTFNGEIFNYIELRETLVAKGHRFYTHTDTEVIVHLYEEHGERFVDHLNGQFAIAIWDSRQKKAVLCRDRVGIAPLYYHLNGDSLAFCSEIKGLLAIQEHSPTVNLETIDQTLTFWSAVSPSTCFTGINEVKPGELIQFHATSGRIIYTQYWDYPFLEKGAGEEITDEISASRKVRELLEDAISIRLRADVPVGAYLSGGLDSTIIASTISSRHNNKLKTFSLTFKDEGLDESTHQREVVAHLGTEHLEVLCRDEDIADNFLDSIWHTESPIIRSAPIPMGILSGLAHEHGYKVVLTGEGADEVFGGYDLFKETKLREFWSRQPDSFWRPNLIKRLYPYLDFGQRGSSAFLKSFFGGGVENANSPLFSHLPRMATTSQVKRFYSSDTKEHLSNYISAGSALEQTLPRNFNHYRVFNKAQYIESKTLMAGYLLNSQGDRMLMKNSVEGRFPFLDHRLIEYASRLHPKLKMKGFNEKYILKKAMEPYIPAAIFQRHKQPYRAPNIPSFFGANQPAYIQELLSTEYLTKTGLFDPKSVSLLLKKISSGRASSYRDNIALVFILSMQVWFETFILNFHKNFKINDHHHISRIS